MPAKLFSIDTASWTHKSVDVKDVDGDASKFVNCVAISDDLILLALWYSYAVFNKELDEINNLCRTSIDPRCRLIMSLTDSFDKSYLLLAFSVKPFDCKNTYDAVDRPGYNTLLTKAKIDVQSGKLTSHETADNSTLLQNAYVDSIIEVATNKMLVSVKPTDLLLVDNWTVTSRIRDEDTGNTEKL